MNKKLLSLVLTLVMVLGTFTSVFAAETKTTEKVEKITGKDNKIQYVVDKKLVEGYKDGSLGLDKNITRAEITKLLAIANGNKDLAAKLQGAMKLYSDVDNSHWANGVITVGTTVPSATNGQPMLQGYPDGSFKPENNVTYAELAKMLVVLVKTDLTADMVKEANAKWAGLWLTWAQQLGILDDVTVADSNAAANRGDAFTMVYNALYKMQNFRRTAANEKLGVLSSLNRDKLVLNQDAKEQEYTITTDTVFVNANRVEGNNANVIKVKNITNPDFYLGSLVRIITNDKKEVTHILELGNPSALALNADANRVVKNSRWNGVADYTVETGLTNVSKLTNDKMQPVFDGWVKVNFRANDTKVDSLTFQDGAKDVVTVGINSDTKVFVANPANNIMKEVKDINEAMSLIGYNQARWNMIPNVYAGFNQDGHKAVVDAFNQNDRNTAKVVVFNVVAKSAKTEMFRVVNQASSLGNATLEDTDGKVYDRNFFNNMSAFPYNYGDLYDVIKVNYMTNANTDGLETVIDHSDKVKFPVVEVKGFANDKRVIDVVDKYGDMSSLDVRDADIFNAKQYRDLRVGDKLQFTVEKGTIKVEVLSILPANTTLEGSIQKMLPNISNRTRVGMVTNVGQQGNDYIVDMKVFRDNFNSDANYETKTYIVNKEDADYLAKLVAKDVKVQYEVQSTNDRNLDGRAYNFKVNDLTLKAYLEKVALDAAKADLQKAIDSAKAKLENVKESADGTDVAKGEKWATKADRDAFKAAIDKAEQAMGNAKVAKDATDAKADLGTATTTFDGKVTTKD
ncbi:S-layer homology domain-containing protein [Peptoniphilus asaccharolyticus DSM 20463]|uniref:S-layer homology domain-containing protein n=1 Tax=Peptoniphilus asaccharolyticus DSM 20463 TaxID=573058 RepID=A0A1W1UGV4_PEPAS|nr:S-layer homology domain-containing protein [Peptoniphilus asaccharolyticus]MBL7574701.1 S-layer homology domain-containing protein [Peptoniphilus asaccharolyticus]SMB80307.1 S-layer homology domain-containing protein [Peptoniphilus asaccharolyticus DSM 20463]